MKKIYTFLLLTCNIITFAQVGINTTNPQEELHIAGSNSSIRVEGLNAANNVKNLGVGNTTRVFVDANGDLVLGAATNNIEILFNPFNYLADPQVTGSAQSNDINQTGTGSGYTSAGWPRQLGAGLSTFTLLRPAIVEINYSLSWMLQKSGNPIDDGHARIIQTFMVLRSGGPTGPIVSTDYEGVPITLGGALGLNGQFHTNAAATGASGHPYVTGAAANHVINKYMYNTGTDYVKLGPGTYCPMFFGQCAVGDTGGTGAVKMFIGGGQDEVQIIAHYYN